MIELTARVFGLFVVCAAFCGSIARADDQPSPSSSSDTASLFNEACRVYESAIDAAEQGKPDAARDGFRAAAARFESLARDHGAWGSGVWANAGLAYASAGDPGRAVLSYRRAAIIDPWNDEIRRGLEHARALVRVDAPADKAWSTREIVRGLALRLPTRGVWIAGLALYIAGFVLLACVLSARARTRHSDPRQPHARRAPWTRRTLRVGWACVVLGVVCTAAASAGTLASRSRDGVIVASRVTARQGPSELLHAPAFDEPLGAGVEVGVLESRRGWLRVRLRDGRECWTPESAVELVLPARDGAGAAADRPA
ncbi:MAG: hypothetical protein RBS39_09445 [Phycisphaerales bacterium]|jgi:hypothetical protein|nr:hypothetical protein [Phycisphaerales bacterium]